MHSKARGSAAMPRPARRSARQLQPGSRSRSVVATAARSPRGSVCQIAAPTKLRADIRAIRTDEIRSESVCFDIGRRAGAASQRNVPFGRSRARVGVTDRLVLVKITGIGFQRAKFRTLGAKSTG